MLLGFIGDELIATAHAISDLTSVAYLADVAIDPRFQGQGLGRRLMDRVMQDLAPLGKVFIYSVPEKLAFYEKYGFHDLTTGMVFAEGDALWRLQLGATCVNRALQRSADKNRAADAPQNCCRCQDLSPRPTIVVADIFIVNAIQSVHKTRRYFRRDLIGNFDPAFFHAVPRINPPHLHNARSLKHRIFLIKIYLCH